MSANNPLSNIPSLGQPSGMMPAPGVGKFRTLDPLRVLRQYMLLLICAAVVGTILGVGTWYVLDQKLPTWSSFARLKVNAGSTDASRPDSDTTVIIRQLEPEINNQIAFIKSERLLNELLKRDAVRQTEWYQEFGNVEDAREDLQLWTLSAIHLRGSTMIQISAGTRNSNDAQTILSELVDVYLKNVEERQNNHQERARQSFQADKEAAQADINNIQVDIETFDIAHPRTTRQESLSENNRTLLRLSDNRVEALDELASGRAYYDQLIQRQQSGIVEPSADEIPQIEQSFSVRQLTDQIRNSQIARRTLIDQGFGEDHSTVENLAFSIQSIERELEAERDKQAREILASKLENSRLVVTVTEERIAALDPQIQELVIELQDLYRLNTEREGLERKLLGAEDRYTNASNNLKDADIIAKRTVTVQQHTAPTTADKSFPKPELIIPAVSIGFFALIVGLVFVREMLDQRVKAPSDIKSIPDATMLGMIPDAGEDPSGKKPVERVVEKLPTGLLAESFRQVRTAMLSKMDRRGYKTVVLVGAKPGAGVSSIVQNLGASMALSGRRVLILDANFRRPGQAALSGVTQSPGLVEILRGEAGSDPTAHVQAMSQAGLSLLPAGECHGAPPELLESAAFRELLSQLETDFDIILIDAPPALLTSEAQLLAKHVDAIALISRARTDTRGMIQRMISQLDGQRADILGVILNGVQASVGGYLGKNFQEFHRYQENSKAARGKKSASNGRAANQQNGRKRPGVAEGKDTSDDTAIVDAMQDINEFEDDLD